MEVLLLTVFISLCLAVWFIVAFVRHATKPNAGAWEREALLPLEDDPGRSPDAAVPAEIES